MTKGTGVRMSEYFERMAACTHGHVEGIFMKRGGENPQLSKARHAGPLRSMGPIQLSAEDGFASAKTFHFAGDVPKGCIARKTPFEKMLIKKQTQTFWTQWGKERLG